MGIDLHLSLVHVCSLCCCCCRHHRGPLRGGLGEVAAALVGAVARLSGLAAARKLYASLMKLPLPGGDFVHAVLDLELWAPEAQGAGQLPAAAMREVFEVRLCQIGCVGGGGKGGLGERLDVRFEYSGSRSTGWSRSWV